MANKNLADELNELATTYANDVMELFRNHAIALIGGGKVSTIKVPRLGTRQRKQVLCPVENCGKPGGGPKWGWFCADHKDLPTAEKKKWQKKRWDKSAKGA